MLRTVLLSLMLVLGSEGWVSPFESHEQLTEIQKVKLDVFSTEEFGNFIPHDNNFTCTGDKHATPFNMQVRGTNLGGWLVLEPWIAPSLFYQFLNSQSKYGDEAPVKTGMDMHSFCSALGPEEANRQLRIHWQKFVTEDDFKKLKEYGVNSIRIPVGDWMFQPYEPYIGCTDGSVEELDRAMDLANKYGINVLIDIHGHIGSQNGFDNSGMTHTLKWTSLASSLPIGTTTFEHWPIRRAEWVGTWDEESKNYSSINYNHISHSIKALKGIVDRYKDHPAILGVQPINEPWELTPIEVLKEFYWEGYKLTKSIAPKWKYVMHDSFRFGVPFWGDFMKGCPDRALDTHIYQAWNTPTTHENFYSNACQQKYVITKMEQTMMPVIVGEWSLATDNCAMWLNGFNDNLPGFPKVQCRMISCPESYLGNDFPGLPLDKTKPIPGPYGTGTSGPSFGKCPVTSNNSFQISDDEMFRNLGRKKLNAFNYGHGWYFWNFKTELDDKWSFFRAVENGWFPKNVSALDEDVNDACKREDVGDFVCIANRGASEFDLQKGYDYACDNGVDCDVLDEQYEALVDKCDQAFNAYWHVKRLDGATCDFGGAALLKSPSDVQLPPLQDHVLAGHDEKVASQPKPQPEEQDTNRDINKSELASSALSSGFSLLGMMSAAAVFAAVGFLVHRRSPSSRSYKPIPSRV